MLIIINPTTFGVLILDIKGKASGNCHLVIQYAPLNMLKITGLKKQTHIFFQTTKLQLHCIIDGYKHSVPGC